MRKLALVAIALAVATPALAQSVSPYRYSGQHAGGPADGLISPTGGIPQPTRRTYHDPAYRYSGPHAGGPADALISETGGPVRTTRIYSDPAYRYSGQHAGGPAADLNPN
jgi:hypothetical protein